MTKALVEVEFPENRKTKIVPGDIVTWVNKYTIPAILNRRSQYMSKELSDFILKAPKLFLICVFINLPADQIIVTMEAFKQCMITDDHIPLTEAIVQRIFARDRLHHQFFIDYQSIFLGRILPTTSVFSRIQMGSEEIFPFTSVSKIADGVFATVWRATVHGSFLHPKAPNVR